MDDATEIILPIFCYALAKYHDYQQYRDDKQNEVSEAYRKINETKIQVESIHG